MMEIKNLFDVGDLVTFKTHPLFNSFRIKGDSKYVPPIMMIKEVLFENKQKKTNDEETGVIIAERIKYICIYFDDNKSEFVEAHLYQSMLRTFEDLMIEKIDRNGNIIENYITLIEEIKKYKQVDYAFGKTVYFKTKKIEMFKKRSSKKIVLSKNEDGSFIIDLDKTKELVQYVVNYCTPNFIICGIKKEEINDLFYSDGKQKKLVSNTLLKVKWFNPFQQKFSEHFLPIEFFTDEMNFD